MLGIGAFVLLAYLPIGALCLPLIERLREASGLGFEILRLALPAGRTAGLLRASIGLALASTLLAGLLGGLAALSDFPRRPALRWLPLVLFAVPPYVHALAWSTLAFRLGRVGGAIGFDLPTSGPIMATFVMAMARLPLTYGLSALALALLPVARIEAAQTLRGPAHVLLRIVLPLTAPVAGAGLALAFLLSLQDYGVPALFQVRVLALGVFADYSATGDAARALAMSLPLVALALVACLGLVAGWRRAALAAPRRTGAPRAAGSPAQLGPRLRRITTLAMSLLLLQSVLLIASLLIAAGSPARLVSALLPARADLIYSLLLSAAAALLVLGPAFALARRMADRKPSASAQLGLWFATLLPLAIPAPLFGIGLIRLWRGPLSIVPADAFLPVLATAGRFLPLAVVILAAALSRRDTEQIDAARIHQPNAWAGWTRVGFPLSAPSLSAAAGVVFALGLGELGATLMVLPPGRSTLAARTFNYLHYGASESVAGACLMLAVASALAAAAALHALAVGQRYSQAGEAIR